MMAKTHIISGLLVGGLMLQSPMLTVDNPAVFVVAAGLGSLLPDIDHPQSLIAQFIPIVGAFISRLVSHRGFFHSVFGSIVIFFIMGMVIPDFKESYTLTENNLTVGGYATVWHGLLLGYWVHILGDLLTVSGVKLLYPAGWNIRIPIFRTGGIGELLFRWCLIACLGLLAFHLFNNRLLN